MRQGSLWLAGFDKRGAEIVFRNTVAAGYFKGVGEQRDAVMPVADLFSREINKRKKKDQKGDSENLGIPSTFFCQIRKQPNDCDKNSDEREIGIAVSHALAARLNEPNHWKGGTQIPEPANHETFPAAIYIYEHGYPGDEHGGQQNLPGSKGIFRMWIENCQPGGPDGLPQVCGVGIDDVLHSPRQWHGRREGFFLTMNFESNPTSAGRH